jgi:hypothetical protein
VRLTAYNKWLHVRGVSAREGHEQEGTSQDSWPCMKFSLLAHQAVGHRVRFFDKHPSLVGY